MVHENESHRPAFVPSLLILMITISSLAIPAYATSSSIQDVKTSPLSTHGYSLGVMQDANSTGEALGLGWLSEDVPADARVTPVYAAALPTHFDWRSNSGSSWMTPVKNQGGCGSCVAFGAVGATEAQFRIQAGNPGWSLDLSEQHLFSCGGGSCSKGWYISGALNYLKNYGIPDESCSPYRAQSGQASCSNSCPDWQSRAFKIASWSWVANNPSALQAALMNGPLVAGFNVYRDFFSYHGGVYHYDGHSSLAGGHAIAIVGYDSNEQYWIVKNSWGSYWGESGYFRIGFGEAGIENYVASISASYSVTFYTDPSSGTVTADGATKTDGQAAAYPDGQRVHIIAGPPSGYSFANWEVNGVTVDNQFSLDTHMTVSNNGWLKAYYTQANSITLSFTDYPSMFIVGQTAKVTVVIGASQSHPPSASAHTIDVAGTNSIVASLPHYADTGYMDSMMDTQAAHAVGSSIVLDVTENVITAGGPTVNYIWKYYNDEGTLPAYFNPFGTVYISSTNHRYSMVNDYYQGKPVTDYAIVELHADGSRNVLLVAGISGFATYYACKWLAAATADGTMRTYDGQAIILKLYDADGDPLASSPTITVQETV